MRGGEGMKILVVSDTHGRDEELEQVVEREAPFDMLIHCGDIEGREFFIEALAECPCCLIAGNNDFFSDLLQEEEITLCGHRALVTHGHYYGVSLDISGVIEEAESRDCDMVFFGHTHRPVTASKDGVFAMNPGSLSYPRQPGRKPSYGVLHMQEDGSFEAEIRYVDMPGGSE